jgi:sulfur-oxidizing protein SoxY
MTNMKRRVFLKGSLTAGAVGVAVGAGLLSPRTVLAAWPKKAFESKEVAGALSALLGTDRTTTSADITIKAPDIAENGAVVPITVSSGMSGISQIALVAENNPFPLVASFNMTDKSVGYVSTRIKMGKTGDVIGVVKAGGKVYSARKPVKVTIGGCGG